MSDTLAALIAFIVWLFCILAFILMWKLADLNSPPKLPIAREALRRFKHASNWSERLAVIFFYSPFFASTGLKAILVTFITAGSGVLIAIFGSNIPPSQDPTILPSKPLRKMLIYIIEFLERHLNPPSQPQGSITT
jgi:hypothetical protein